MYFISTNIQFIMLKLYIITGIVCVLIAMTLFFLYNSVLKMALILL